MINCMKNSLEFINRNKIMFLNLFFMTIIINVILVFIFSFIIDVATPKAIIENDDYYNHVYNMYGTNEFDNYNYQTIYKENNKTNEKNFLFILNNEFETYIINKTLGHVDEMPLEGKLHNINYMFYSKYLDNHIEEGSGLEKSDFTDYNGLIPIVVGNELKDKYFVGDIISDKYFVNGILEDNISYYDFKNNYIEINFDDYIFMPTYIDLLDFVNVSRVLENVKIHSHNADELDLISNISFNLGLGNRSFVTEANSYKLQVSGFLNELSIYYWIIICSMFILAITYLVVSSLIIDKNKKYIDILSLSGASKNYTKAYIITAFSLIFIINISVIFLLNYLFFKIDLICVFFSLIVFLIMQIALYIPILLEKFEC